MYEVKAKLFLSSVQAEFIFTLRSLHSIELYVWLKDEETFIISNQFFIDKLSKNMFLTCDPVLLVSLDVCYK